MAINMHPSQAAFYKFQGGAALGAGIGGGLADASHSLGQFFERMQKEKDIVKQEAKLATSLRKTLKDLDAHEALRTGREPSPAKFDLMGPQELKGAFDAVGMKGAMDARAQQEQLMAQQIKRLKRDEQNTEAFPTFAKLVDFAGQAGVPMTPRTIFSAAGAAGYNPGGSFDDIIRAFTPKEGGWNLKPGDVSDVGGVKRIAVSPNSFQVVEPGGGRVAMKDAPKIEGYDILPTDKGGWRYSKKSNEKAQINPRDFDSNGDGELNEQEAQQANLAAILAKSGMVLPGTKVGGAGRAATPAKEGGLFEKFQQWRTGK